MSPDHFGRTTLPKPSSGTDLFSSSQPAGGKWEAGERGIACLDRTGEFEQGVGRALEYARALGRPQPNCLVGLTPTGVDAERVRQTLVNSWLRGRRVGRAGVRLLVEPVNPKDIPGFHLIRVGKAVASWTMSACRCVSPVRLLPPATHGWRIAGDLPPPEGPDRARPNRGQPGVMSPARARSTTASSSRPSIARGTKAGSAANTNRRPRPRPGLAGPQNTWARRSVRTEHEEQCDESWSEH